VAGVTVPAHVTTPPRLDRHDTYVGILIYVWFAGLGIFLLPIGTGTIGAMDPDQQKLLAMCMLIGSTLCLLGSAAGEPADIRVTYPVRWVLKRHFVRKLLGHPYLPLPTRHCYRLGVAGLVANVTAFAFFSVQLLGTGSIVGTMTGLLPPILVVVWTRKARKLWRHAVQMDRDFEQIKKGLQE
jgi:hypothetical protein